jgi:hypothetical protein
VVVVFDGAMAGVYASNPNRMYLVPELFVLDCPDFFSMVGLT